MFKIVHIKMQPEMHQWVQGRAQSGFRLVPSVVLEVLAEKMNKEASWKQGDLQKLNYQGVQQ